jgi:hypothetical protein
MPSARFPGCGRSSSLFMSGLLLLVACTHAISPFRAHALNAPEVLSPPTLFLRGSRGSGYSQASQLPSRQYTTKQASSMQFDESPRSSSLLVDQYTNNMVIRRLHLRGGSDGHTEFYKRLMEKVQGASKDQRSDFLESMWDTWKSALDEQRRDAKDHRREMREQLVRMGWQVRLTLCEYMCQAFL